MVSKTVQGKSWRKGLVLALGVGVLATGVLACQPEGQKVPQSAPIAPVAKTFPEPPPPKVPAQVALAMPSPQPQATHSSPGPTSASTQGDATAGQGLFAQMCNVCHPGGQKGLGPTLVGVTGRLGGDGIEKVIKGGQGMMPPFSGRMDDKGLADLLSYLGALK